MTATASENLVPNWDPESPMTDAQYALDLASVNGHADVVEVLLDAHPSPAGSIWVIFG